jgi:hypothetical protein
MSCAKGRPTASCTGITLSIDVSNGHNPYISLSLLIFQHRLSLAGGNMVEADSCRSYKLSLALAQIMPGPLAMTSGGVTLGLAVALYAYYRQTSQQTEMNQSRH